MEQINLLQYTSQELKEVIQNAITDSMATLQSKLQPKKADEYLTRQEVADLFKVDLSTIHNWCKQGKLKPYGIGSRVYFLRADIDNCLIPLNN
ncbi:DNA binding domain-containing protein, excisionase family [Paenimyroides ummariense]|uniref:DNA binding domain-containing protein, excisionase family n=1 Tax=Paenimyroides ummariense TaxID=913024 RepID=A0A1I4W7S1_9FLAO|nr:helix-turn-helix domain-containing protein [Paenimyroides ummariense]SFN09427.1 DNA binding domain-containing protein, excisionase family [Paenimyroides ummariense]